MQNSKEKTLSQRIAERIIKYILEENLQPGDKLPNETVMCERLNVGRSSLREAMRALASRNVITIRQGSGSYVSATPGMIDDPFGLTFVEDKQKMIKDLMEIRFLIEPSIAAMAAIRADETDIKNILTACENTEKLLLANKNHAEKDIAFHTAIALSSKNIVVPKLVPIINSSIPLIRESAKLTMRDETIQAINNFGATSTCTFSILVYIFINFLLFILQISLAIHIYLCKLYIIDIYIIKIFNSILDIYPIRFTFLICL